MPQSRLLLAGLAALLLLSGCAQKAGPGAAPSTGPAASTGATGTVAGAHPWMVHPEVTLAPGQEPVAARFAYDGPLNATTVLAGSFAPQQVCPIGICALGEQSSLIDLSDHLPMGLPLHVTADLEASSLLGADSLFAVAPAGDRLDDAGYKFTGTALRDAFALQRNADGPVQLRVARGDTGMDAGFAYKLTLTVEVLTTHFDARTPVAVQVPAGATAIAVEEATPGGDVRAWDGKDTYLGNRSLASGFALIPAQQGEYVLQFSGATAAVHLSVLAPANTPAPRLRALGFTRTAGEVHDATGAAPVTWSFNVDGVPLGVGFTLASDPAKVLFAEAGGDLQLRNPSGLLVAELQQNLCVCSLQRSVGAYGSVAPTGSYAVSYTATGAAAVQVSHYVDTYAR